MIKAQVLSDIAKLFFQSPNGVSWYKFHHDIAWNTLTSSSHLLLNLFSFARGKELLKHQQESFSQCEIVLLNLSFFPQHPIISTVAIAGSDSCFSRYLFAVLWGFHPSSPLTRCLSPSSHNTKSEGPRALEGADLGKLSKQNKNCMLVEN